MAGSYLSRRVNTPPSKSFYWRNLVPFLEMKGFFTSFPFRVLRIEQGSVLAHATSRMLIVAELQSFYSW